MDRVKYFTQNDLSYGLMLSMIPRLVETFDPALEFVDINDALEYYNVCRFIHAGSWLTTWSEDYIVKLKSIENQIYRNVARFFSLIEDTNFIEILTQVNLIFIDDFLLLLCTFKNIEKIQWESILSALLDRKIYLYHLLTNQQIVQLFGENIRQTILSNPVNAELILSDLSFSFGQRPDRFFPKELTNEDLNTLFLEYINLSNPNINYIKQIVNFKNGSSRYKITKELRFAAKQKLEQVIKSVSDNQPDITFEFSLLFHPQTEQKLKRVEGNKTIYSIDSNFIRNNLDFYTLLYNFIYLFQYFDSQFQMLLIRNPDPTSIFTYFTGGRNKSDYFISNFFEFTNGVADLALRGYYYHLSKYGINLEDIFQWFYSDYLLQEFGIKDFGISLPSKEVSFLEKCKSIAIEFEAILKKYYSLKKFNKIDSEYIANVSPEISYTDLPSLCQDNYAYPKSQEIEGAMFHLFSAQSSSYYLTELGIANRDCLFDQIHINQIQYSFFSVSQLTVIEQLIKMSILHRTPDKDLLQVTDLQLVDLLRQLWEFGYLSVLNYSPIMRTKIDALISNGHLFTSSSLLSVQEGNYFNYYLNDSEFGNSIGLRNKYTHGTPGGNCESDYFSFLKLIVLLTIKIDNDLQNSNFSISDK